MAETDKRFTVLLGMFVFEGPLTPELRDAMEVLSAATQNIPAFTRFNDVPAGHRSVIQQRLIDAMPELARVLHEDGIAADMAKGRMSEDDATAMGLALGKRK